MSIALTLEPSVRGDLPLFELNATREWGVDAFVTGRRGGVSADPYGSLNLGTHVGDDVASVVANRRRVAQAAGVEPANLVTSRQVHGPDVNDVDGWSGEDLVGDALVTTRGDLALCVMVADCVPLLFVDTMSRRLAVAHAGWRGLRAGVIGATLAMFTGPHHVRVVIGPHISSDTYQVGPEVAQHFEGVAGAVIDDVGDRSRLDLAAITVSQLAHCGVDTDAVLVCRPGTDGGQMFFSDRAQRPCGRFGLVARSLYDSSPIEGDR